MLSENTWKYFADKVKTQNGVATFFDSLVLNQGAPHKPDREESLSMREINMVQRAKETLDIHVGERYVRLKDRLANTLKSDMDIYDRICSQGTTGCIQWKGRPLLKSAQDFVLYPMLIWELRPNSIIELGSTSSSLEWLADLVRVSGLKSKIVGVDHHIPDHVPVEAEFIHGDIEQIDRVLNADYLRNLPKPWLVIEDAHTNLFNLLEWLFTNMSDGDYLVIEDSLSKQGTISQWVQHTSMSKAIYVDTYYTDFFGVNSSTAVNSVLKKINMVGDNDEDTAGCSQIGKSNY